MCDTADDKPKNRNLQYVLAGLAPPTGGEVLMGDHSNDNQPISFDLHARLIGFNWVEGYVDANY